MTLSPTRIQSTCSMDSRPCGLYGYGRAPFVLFRTTTPSETSVCHTVSMLAGQLWIQPASTWTRTVVMAHLCGGDTQSDRRTNGGGTNACAGKVVAGRRIVGEQQVTHRMYLRSLALPAEAPSLATRQCASRCRCEGSAAATLHYPVNATTSTLTPRYAFVDQDNKTTPQYTPR